MPALAASAVSLYPTDGSAESYPYGKGNRGVIQRRLKLVLTGQGTAVNPIGAQALGFGTLISCTNLWDGTAIYGTMIDPTANILLIGTTDSGVPLDVTAAAAYITVIGTPKPLSGTY